MDNYAVGSVADIISPNLVSKVKSKRKKKFSESEREIKLNSNECLKKTLQLEIENDIAGTEHKNLEKKRDKKLKKESLIKKKIVDSDMKLKIDPKSKKRKKENKKMSDTGNLETELTLQPKPKRKKLTLLELDHVPSDSEEDNENLSQQTNKNKALNKKKEYKDFTANTVFVGNIPLNYDKQKISKVFSKFGKVISARIRCVPIAEINMSKKVAAVKKQFNPKRNSLVAYVKFESVDSANAALEANGMVIDGHHLRVDLAEGNRERDNNKAVFVGGLSFDIEDDELWEFFKDCGKINSVRVIRDSQTSMGKGFGYVNFDSSASVELALQLDGQELKKRNINVKRCIRARNKNKLNAFGRKKSKEMTDQLLCKKGKKFKSEKKKSKMENKSLPNNFQGNKANVKHKKKKKLSKAALHKRKIIKILGAS